MNGVISDDGKFITFTTNHFSVYKSVVENVQSTEPETPAGVTVSGSTVSWHDDVEDYRTFYMLYLSTIDDATIKAEWNAGEFTNAKYTADKSVVEAVNVDVNGTDKSMKSQTFTFTGVAEGTYKLVLLKEGKYVPKIVEITVGTENVEVGQQKLWLYGDVYYDGVVDTNDVIQMNRYINTKGSLITTGTEEEKAEKKTVCDIDCDGDIDTNDVVQMNRYINTKGSLFNNFK